MLYTAPCVSFSPITKPNFVLQLFAQNPDSQLENPLPPAASFLFRPIITDILRQNYLLTLFQVIFQQLLLSTHQAGIVYHIQLHLSTPSFDFFDIFLNIYKLFTFNNRTSRRCAIFPTFCQYLRFFVKYLLTKLPKYVSIELQDKFHL